MSTAPRRRLPTPLEIVTAPGVWLERSRGIRRAALLALYAAVATALAGLAWRAFRFSQIPEPGEPFDLAAFRSARVPAADDAAPLYARAAERLRLDPQTVPDEIGAVLPEGGPDEVPPALRAWSAANHDALVAWREATERPTADFRSLRRSDSTNLIPALRALSALALIEAANREATATPEEAWTWYRAALRCSRHLSAGGGSESRILGAQIYSAAADAALRWADDGRVESPALRTALDDALALEPMTPPPSTTLKADYLTLRLVLDTPDLLALTQPTPAGGADAWKHSISRFLAHEPGRSRRIARLIFANWLAHCDQPPTSRPPTSTALELFAPDPAAPPPSRLLAPEPLMTLYDASELGRLAPTAPILLPILDDERRTRARLIVGLASERFFRDNRTLPNFPGMLVPAYLKAIPDAYLEESSTDDTLP